MAENGYITDAQADAAMAEPLVTQTRALGSQAADVDYYVEEVRRLLYEQIWRARRFMTAACRCAPRSTRGCRIIAVSALAHRPGAL